MCLCESCIYINEMQVLSVSYGISRHCKLNRYKNLGKLFVVVVVGFELSSSFASKYLCVCVSVLVFVLCYSEIHLI